MRLSKQKSLYSQAGGSSNITTQNVGRRHREVNTFQEFHPSSTLDETEESKEEEQQRMEGTLFREFPFEFRRL